MNVSLKSSVSSLLPALSLRIHLDLLALILSSVFSAHRFCLAQDIFRVNREVPPTPASQQLGKMPCRFGPLPQTLGLGEAVERALCTNPKTLEAWVNIQIQAYAVGIDLAMYLPSLSGTWQETYEDTSTAVTGYPQYNSAFAVFTGSGSASLNWTLYDFGGRKATIRGAKYLLDAARSTAAATLQDVFATTAAHFLSLQAAQSKLETAKHNEMLAENTLEVTRQRVDSGAAPISDSLQAETAHLQAMITREQAEGDLAMAQGQLAYDEGLRPNATLAVPRIEDSGAPDQKDLEQVASTLLDEAVREQPSVVAARDQVLAAQTKVSQLRSAGLPSFSLVGRVSRSEQPASISLGVPPYLSTVHDSYIGVQVTVPLFEGFSRAYGIQQAHAQVTLQKEMLRETERQVELAVWIALQAEKTALRAVLSAHALVEVAQRAYSVAEERYRSGVGGVIDLLSSQTALETARGQNTAAQATWHASQFTLSSKVGRLSINQLRSGTTP